MKVFVTGATGFIGSNFLNLLLKNDINVIALRRVNSLPRIKINYKTNWVEGNLDDNLERHLLGCDVLVHFAAHTPNPPYDTYENCLYWNLTAPMLLFEKARKLGIKKFIIAGSCFEYGISAERYEFIPINAPLLPISSYPASKAVASIAFESWARENKLEMQILRIFHVFGPGEQSSRLWPSLKSAADSGGDFLMTKGEQVRDFIHVDEVAKHFLSSLSFEGIRPGHPVIRNIGTGKPKSILEFSKFWWDAFGAKGKLIIGALPYRKNEVMRFVPEI